MSLEVVNVAKVYLWGSLIGYVSWDAEREIGAFEYDEKFLKSFAEPAPIKMPKKIGVYEFPGLARETYKGLPGMLADALPDKFGNALIDVWLAKQGRTASSFHPVERLCYLGTRGMGALEFKPNSYKARKSNVPIDIKEMVELASDILSDRKKIKENINGDEKKRKAALTNLLVIGTSAGGARAKCIIAYNEKTGEVRSGQLKSTEEFTYWLLKLDGVADNKDKDLSDPQGYGRIEYAYYLMAKDCEIDMSECRLYEENGRAHFMTKRFDRLKGGEKLHMQSLCGIAHYDFNSAGGYSYEQVLEMIREIVSENKFEALEQQFKRAIFNIIGRNQDDHTKNIGFLMDKKGNWKLSPAFDMSYSYNPKGVWTNQHQMRINGKRDNFTIEDLLEFSKKADLKKNRAIKIIANITDVFKNWEKYAGKAQVFENLKAEVKQNLRTDLVK